METPPSSAKRRRAPSDSPAASPTTAIFDMNDDESPLSSALTLSPINDCDHSSLLTRASPSKRRKARSPDKTPAETARVDTDIGITRPPGAQIEAFKGDYATAAVSRPRRSGRRSVKVEEEQLLQFLKDEEKNVMDECQLEDVNAGASSGNISLEILPTPSASSEEVGECSEPADAQQELVENQIEANKVVSEATEAIETSEKPATFPLKQPQGKKRRGECDDSVSDYLEDQLGHRKRRNTTSSNTKEAAADSNGSNIHPRRSSRNQTRPQVSKTQDTSGSRLTASSSKIRKTKKKDIIPVETELREQLPANIGMTASQTWPRKTAAAKSDRTSLIVHLKCHLEERIVSAHFASQGQPLEQHELFSIAQKLYKHRATTQPKPAPAGKPEVWAEGRQELCETLHYYRSYQSACYSTGGFVRAFMFDKIAHSRDYMDNDVIVSRAGGGLSKDKESGEMLTRKDQNEDSVIVQGLKNCMNHYNPVIIITGKDNPTSPSQPPHQYCVLDYFKPTHIWVEKSQGKKILRYRFEKLASKKQSWWRPENEDHEVPLGSLDAPVQRTYSTCNVPSLQIYLNGWMCLQPSCTAFWLMVNDVKSAARKGLYEQDEAALIYDPRFLKQKVPWPNDHHSYPLVSSGPEISSHALPGEDTSQAFWSGIVCPNCGRCISRLSWMSWECANPKCNFTRTPSHALIPAASLQESFWPLTHNYTLSRDVHSPLVTVKVTFAHNYRINRYQIPGLDGFITHMIANKTVVSEEGGPDTMFEELQQQDIGLRRRSMPNGQLKGDTYCRHFTVNYGMPYKFIAATASHPFSEAARPITATRSRLNWAAKYLLSQENGATKGDVEKNWISKEFNEVLALGYFESQKISYHDDGEFGLGPTIATLSLGAPGTMRIRMKARHYHGVTSTLYDDSRPLPGCQNYEARVALAPHLASLKDTNKPAYRARLKSIPMELGLRASGNAKDVLKMELGHGDIVVMHGAELQKYYEHAVEHGGKLRFALTCRYIHLESLKEGDRPGYVVEIDGGRYDGSVLGDGRD